MVQTFEAIKGGGGSIQVGTTGTISALMSRELDSKKFSPQTPASYRRTLSDEASSSGMSEDNKKCPEIVRKTKHYNRKTNQIPILENDNVFVDGTPIRQKPQRKGPYMVEIVDINCGDVDRTWAGPIKNRLKKLGFSKLSESPV